MGSDIPQDYGMNLPTAMVIASFVTIAWVNTIELQVRIWIGFKRYTGLYFWSLLLSSWGCSLHPLCFLLLDFAIWKNAHVAGVFIGIGWWLMVTGQALVLYSRLHLVVRDKRKIRWVLVMIITNVFILHIPIMILSQTAYSNIPSAPQWLKVYNVYEKVQMTGFTIQEGIISGLYLWETRKILRPGKIFQKKKTRQVFHHLIWVNIFIILLDIALLGTEYANLFSIQTVFKAAIYSLKLRFEFIVLNALMDIVQGRSSAFDLSANASAGYGTSRSAQNMHMEKINGRGSNKDPNTYSVYASKGLSSPTALSKGDGVMKTTEVMVHGTPSSPMSGDDYINAHGHGRAHIVSPRMEPRGMPHAMSPPSPDHSEVEFAAKGA